MKEFLRKWWPILAWATVIAVSSSTYISTKGFVEWMAKWSPWKVTEEQFGEFWGRWWWVFVKGYHVLEFSVLFLLLVATVRRTRLKALAVLAVSYLGAVGYAALDEWHQTFVPLRGGRVTDVLIDLSGVTLIAVFLLLRRRRVADP